MYRAIARATVKEEGLRLWGNDRVLAFLQLPSPEVVVNVSRLRYMISRPSYMTFWSIPSQLEWKEFHFEFLHQCINAGWQHEFPWPEAADHDNQDGLECCLACGMVFKNRAAWSVHAFRTHRRRNPCRRVIGGTRCDACSKEYRSTARLLAHLRYSQGCLVNAGKTYEELFPGIGNHRVGQGGTLACPGCTR